MVISAVQTPVLSPPAPAPAKKTPAPAKKTPAPGKELRLLQKILGLCKFIKIGNFYSLNWKRHLCFLFNTSHSSHQHFVICMMHGIVFAKTRRKVNVVKTFYY